MLGLIRSCWSVEATSCRKLQPQDRVPHQLTTEILLLIAGSLVIRKVSSLWREWSSGLHVPSATSIYFFIERGFLMSAVWTVTEKESRLHSQNTFLKCDIKAGVGNAGETSKSKVGPSPKPHPQNTRTLPESCWRTSPRESVRTSLSSLTVSNSLMSHSHDRAYYSLSQSRDSRRHSTFFFFLSQHLFYWLLSGCEENFNKYYKKCFEKTSPTWALRPSPHVHRYFLKRSFFFAFWPFISFQDEDFQKLHFQCWRVDMKKRVNRSFWETMMPSL